MGYIKGIVAMCEAYNGMFRGINKVRKRWIGEERCGKIEEGGKGPG